MSLERATLREMARTQDVDDEGNDRQALNHEVGFRDIAMSNAMDWRGHDQGPRRHAWRTLTWSTFGRHDQRGQTAYDVAMR